MKFLACMVALVSANLILVDDKEASPERSTLNEKLNDIQDELLLELTPQTERTEDKQLSTEDLKDVITEWDNTLPLLIYHGVSQNCEIFQVPLLRDTLEDVAEAAGHKIHAECLIVGSQGKGETYTSLFEDMPKQAADYCSQVQKHPVFGKSDFNIVAMSQGGQASRHMIQDCDLGQYKVRNYLSLAGPQQGVQMTPWCFSGVWCNILTYLEDHLDGFEAAQDHLAPADYWNNPKPEAQKAMLEYSIWLPYINNMKQHDKYNQYKSRFEALNRAQFVKFQNDTVIYPNTSTQFGSRTYEGQDLEMTETQIYKDDTIGLKTMNEAGKLSFIEIPNQDHITFTKDDVLTKFLPFLYQKGWKQ